MKNESTKSWSVVVPVSGRCWLNARHALRNSSEGLYLKEKLYIYVSVSTLIKKKKRLSSTLTFILSSLNTQTEQHPRKRGTPRKYGVFLGNMGWIQCQRCGLASELFWRVSQAHCPFYPTVFRGWEKSAKHSGGPRPSCNSWHAGQWRVVLLTLDQIFSAWVTWKIQRTQSIPANFFRLFLHEGHHKG